MLTTTGNSQNILESIKVLKKNKINFFIIAEIMEVKQENLQKYFNNTFFSNFHNSNVSNNLWSCTL